MPIENTFQRLALRCKEQRDALNELQITLAEDRPLHDAVKLVDRLGEMAGDALGEAEEALLAAAEGQRAVAGTVDWTRARQVLTDCQRCTNRLHKFFFAELTCYEMIEELMSLGRKRGGEWRAWAELAGETLQRCRAQLFATQEELLQCWQELVERLSPFAESPPVVGGVQQTTPQNAPNIAFIDDRRAQQKRLLS